MRGKMEQLNNGWWPWNKHLVVVRILSSKKALSNSMTATMLSTADTYVTDDLSILLPQFWPCSRHSPVNTTAEYGEVELRLIAKLSNYCYHILVNWWQLHTIVRWKIQQAKQSRRPREGSISNPTSQHCCLWKRLYIYIEREPWTLSAVFGGIRYSGLQRTYIRLHSFFVACANLSYSPITSGTIGPTSACFK